MNQQLGKVKRETSNGTREAHAGCQSLVDAFDELRRVRGEEETIEGAIRVNRPNGFTSALDLPS